MLHRLTQSSCIPLVKSSVICSHPTNYLQSQCQKTFDHSLRRKKLSESSYRKFFIDEDFSTNAVIRPNNRDEAFTFIKNWLVDEAEEFLIIADPYLKKEDIEVLKLILDIGRDLEIDILGSKSGNQSNIELVLHKA